MSNYMASTLTKVYWNKN